MAKKMLSRSDADVPNSQLSPIEWDVVVVSRPPEKKNAAPRKGTAADSLAPIEWDAVVVSRSPEKKGATSSPEKKSATPPRKKKKPVHAKAIVGGACYVCGGWGEYEAERRHAERDLRCPCLASSTNSPYYVGRTTIGGKDAAESLLAAHPPGALKKAAAHLSKALGNLEDALCDPDDDGLWTCAQPAAETRQAPRSFPSIVVPPLTSSDVDAFIDNEDYMSPDDIYMIANDAVATAAILKEVIEPLPAFKNRTMPVLPARLAPISDDAAVIKLEAAVVPYVTRIEELQSAAASIFDKTATVIDKALANKVRK